MFHKILRRPTNDFEKCLDVIYGFKSFVNLVWEGQALVFDEHLVDF